MLVHEPIVFVSHWARPASVNRGRNHVIHALPAFAGQAYEHFRSFRRIANFLGREAGKFFLCQQHDEYIFANDHAGGGFIGKLRIESETEPGKKTPPTCRDRRQAGLQKSG
jgi:hypothetical protein